MTLSTTALIGAVMMTVSVPDHLPTLGQSDKHEIHEADGHRDFRNNPTKDIAPLLPLADRMDLGFIPVPVYSLHPLDHAELTLEGEILAQEENTPFRYGVPRKLDITDQDGI